MPSIPEISIPNEAEEQLAERLEELEKLLQESESLRRRQFLVSGITLLLMLAVLTFFIIGLVFFFRTYPKRLLMQEVVDRNRQILGNPYHFGVNRKYDRKLIHYFLGETRRELQRRKPLLRQELRTAIRSLNAYARKELRKEFRTRLYRHLAAETKLYLKEKKLEPAARHLVQLRRMNVELSSAVTEEIFGDQETVGREAFDLFQAEVQHLRETDLYRELSGEPLDTVEQRLLENLLECVVCRLHEWKSETGGPVHE